MKINSELPWELMYKYNLSLNEYDFVLFHLYESDSDYREYYKQIRKDYPDRVMIFDNSAYEYFVQGRTLDIDRFKRAIEDLNPTYYILPDVLMDSDKTAIGVCNFINDGLPKCDSKPMGIAQGKTEQEVFDMLCGYKEMDIAHVGLPFHNSFFVDLGKECPKYIIDKFLEEYDNISQDILYAAGRVYFVKKHYSLLKTFDYVHMLGSHCPYEKVFYKEFDSMDTGYPVKLGFEGISLGEEHSKPSTIIDDFFRDHIPDDKILKICSNVERFRKY